MEMGKKADRLRNGELANKAIIDNGCTSNVCSHGWLQCFEGLSRKRFSRIPITGHKKTFIFGAGKGKTAIYRRQRERAKGRKRQRREAERTWAWATTKTLLHVAERVLFESLTGMSVCRA